jgi:hypothetical protein
VLLVLLLLRCVPVPRRRLLQTPPLVDPADIKYYNSLTLKQHAKQFEGTAPCVHLAECMFDTLASSSRVFK